ncbi:MAG: DUF4833 domain-containing protein [Bacteroidetes bacterium]|nr:DUF4833 domain-containing protein [Bacteroidota bacterium]
MLKIYSLLILMSITGTEFAEDFKPHLYPVPPTNENSLFYVQRSKNTNAIVYDLNRMPDGTPNPKNPINIYWIRYAVDSAKEELSYIQQKYAYGLVSRPYNSQKNAYVLQFVSYDKKNFYLLPTSTPKKYAAFTNINGKLAELKKVFIMLNGGTFWFPTIEYIEMIGKDPTTHQMISERFVPKR